MEVKDATTNATNDSHAQLAQLAKELWGVVKPWAQRNVTFSLLLAVLTEVPRWTFAFRAVNEPLWAGIPLAILIAFATAHAWEEYFTEHDWLLLALNIVSLVFAVFTIAPVLFAMIDTPSHDVRIASIFPIHLQWVWASILACTTFLPLIQLAVVEARRRERTQDTRMIMRVVPQRQKTQEPIDPAKQIPERKQDTMPIPAVSVPAIASVAAKVQGSTTLDDLRKWAQDLRSKGDMTLDEIAVQVGKSASWVSRNTESVNA